MGSTQAGKLDFGSDKEHPTQYAPLQALQTAASFSRNVSNFILGEIGLENDEISHDSSQILHTVHAITNSTSESQETQVKITFLLIYSFTLSSR